MQKSGRKHKAVSAHRKVKASTTLNRKYVQRPSQSKGDAVEVAIKRSAKIKHFDVAPVENFEPVVAAKPAKAKRKIEIQAEEPIEKAIAASARQETPMLPAVMHPVQETAAKRLRMRKTAPKAARKLTAKELKDQAIQKALANSSKMIDQQNAEAEKKHKRAKMHFGIGRVILALSCAAVVVVAIGYFVTTNMPDISMRVAAMQTGIEASYPGYVPRDFSLLDISSEEGKVEMNFRNDTNGDAFSLVEENSSWDSNALLTNYVKPEWGENYSIVKEQGLTIYVNEKSDAAWVNGGVVFKLKNLEGELTKKQIRSIAVSL